jgi:tRNA nucleotidyltransferase/poly(A) polymerase
MMLISSAHWDEILGVLRRLAPPSTQLCLVGGAVRDLLRQKPLHDLDWIVIGDVRPLARRVADALAGDFYMLDEERDTARVIDRAPDGSPLFLDFCALRAPDLEADLRARDFTVNAIAFDVRQPERLIDPTGGAADLRAKVLRACSSEAFSNDPIRILRGVRQALAFGFQIEPQTLNWMRQAAALLQGTSEERQRDELVRMLDGGQAQSAIRLLDTFGALAPVLPELAALKGVTQSPPHTLDVWEHTLAVLKELDRLWAVLIADPVGDPAANLVAAAAVARLGRYRRALAGHFAAGLNPNRSLRALLFLAALYHDVSKPAARSVEPAGRIRFLGHEDLGAEQTVARARRLAFSQAEIQRVEIIVRDHMRLHLLAAGGEPPSRRAIYRYFRATGAAGVDIILLSLADLLATYGVTLTQPVWEAELDLAQILLDAWFEQPAQIVRPPRLVTGSDLMTALHLPSGPTIGRLLAAIQEAQATGEITSREQALDFARLSIASE